MNLRILFYFCVVPVFDLSRAIGWLKTVAMDAIKWIALRTLLIGLVTTLVPLAIYEAWSMISEQVLTFVSSQFGSSGLSFGLVEFTGLAAWIGERLKLVECFQVLASFLSFKFILGFIRK